MTQAEYPRLVHLVGRAKPETVRPGQAGPAT
jgi:hypothetical protein